MRMILAMGLAWALTTGGAAAQQVENPEVFVRAVYGSYSDDPAVRPLMDEGLDRVWSSRMTALIARDRELATDDLPYLDADPICNCQDWEGLRVESVGFDLNPFTGDLDARVRFVNAGREQTVVLRLVHEADGWRIDDVINQDGYPGLADALAASNASLEAGGRPQGRE